MKLMPYVLTMLLSLSLSTWGEEGSSSSHRHQPITIDADPLLSRQPINVGVPHRIVFDARGNMFVADYSSGTVIKTTPQLKTSYIPVGIHCHRPQSKKVGT